MQFYGDIDSSCHVTFMYLVSSLFAYMFASVFPSKPECSGMLRSLILMCPVSNSLRSDHIRFEKKWDLRFEIWSND